MIHLRHRVEPAGRHAEREATSGRCENEHAAAIRTVESERVVTALSEDLTCR
jgi:hypothetical protein